MASLSQVTAETRTIFKWGAIFASLILLLFLAYKLYSFLFPAPPPPPTVAFGKLTFELPKNKVTKNLTYSLDTITGTLPSLPTQARVYKIQEPKGLDLLALPRAKERVANIGFTESPTQLSESVYQWRDGKKLSRTLTMNISTNDFNMISSYLTDSSLKLRTTNPSSAIEIATSFLKNLDLYPPDLDTSKTRTFLFSVNNFALSPSTSLSNTDVIKVDLYRKDVNGLPVFYSSSSTSPINLNVSKLNGQAQVVEANFTYQKISDTFATYPIKNAETAYTDLKKNKAYIASSGLDKKILIKKVALGYFMGDTKQNYLVPVVVFEGSNSFQAFVLAITDEWVGN